MLHLVRSRLGMAVALDVASVFIYDQARAATDAQPLVSLGRLDGYDPRLAQAIRLMESHIDRPLDRRCDRTSHRRNRAHARKHFPQIDRRNAGRILSPAAAACCAPAGARHALAWPMSPSAAASQARRRFRGHFPGRSVRRQCTCGGNDYRIGPKIGIDFRKARCARTAFRVRRDTVASFVGRPKGSATALQSFTLPLVAELRAGKAIDAHATTTIGVFGLLLTLL